MDRRGRGGSGDAPVYDIAREYEDVAALVDAVATSSESKVDVYGHSMGSFIAFGAASLTSNIRKLVLYEGWPRINPKGLPYSQDLVNRLDAQRERGDNEALLETYFREVDILTDQEVKELKSMPSWPGRVAAAHTILREDTAYFTTALDPQAVAAITSPTLLLTGEDSPGFLKEDIDVLAAALPDARIVVLEGQQHVADALAPDVVADHLIAFFRGEL
jgi:pimeloyl-ACP methyl ester carboxylesterase